jgi:hypothetical protein
MGTEATSLNDDEPVTVGMVTKVARGEEAVYRIAAREPGGGIILPWALTLVGIAGFIGALFTKPEFAVLCGVLLLIGLGVALDQTWWRRARLTGTETIAVRGNLLIHRAEAFGRVREWEKKLGTMFKAEWIDGWMTREHHSYVAVPAEGDPWRVAFNVEKREGGDWLARELTDAIHRRRGWK